ncbi:putative retinol dehydrogenase [Triangularia verruculosa]|uniref:Retinol dehydrogenase n=1 Tax=Triangularia verruculosa TaxID=2587418 RepID=A0AAN7ATX0_9PEZI|nr:putative retinol dehydrogenase [Triangularia verruculosa]
MESLKNTLISLLGLGGIKFDPSTSIPSLQGKTILITGGNSGLGKATIQALLQHSPSPPARIWLASRDIGRIQSAINEIATAVPLASTIIVPLVLDLASLQSVKAAAEKVLRESERLDIVILNAGVMAMPVGLTQDGYEVHWGINHMGHAALTKLLMPLLIKTAEMQERKDVRIVAVSSGAHKSSPKLDFSHVKTDMKTSLWWTRYAQSKLANILWMKALANQYPEVKCVSLHPGVVSTNIGGDTISKYKLARLADWLLRWMLTKPEVGCLNQLWAAVGPSEQVETGEYYHPVGVKGCGSAWANDQGLATKVFEWTEQELGAQGMNS